MGWKVTLGGRGRSGRQSPSKRKSKSGLAATDLSQRGKSGGSEFPSQTLMMATGFDEGIPMLVLFL